MVMLWLLLVFDGGAGGDQPPNKANFRTVLQSVGLLKNRPVRTTVDVTTRTFKFDAKGFMNKALGFQAKIDKIKPNLLAENYRNLSHEYIASTYERLNLLISEIGSAHFFVLKKFWIQTPVSYPLPSKSLENLIPSKPKPIVTPSRYPFTTEYITTYQKVNVTILTHVRAIYDNGQIDRFRSEFRDRIEQSLAENHMKLTKICEQEGIQVPDHLAILTYKNMPPRQIRLALQNVFDLKEDTIAQNCLTGLLLYLQKSEHDMRLLFNMDLVPAPEAEHVHKHFPDMFDDKEIPYKILRPTRVKRNIWDFIGMASQSDVNDNRLDILNLQNSINTIIKNSRNISSSYTAFKNVADSELSVVTQMNEKISTLYNATLNRVENWDKNRAAITESFDITSTIITVEAILSIIHSDLHLLESAFRHDFKSVYNLLELHRFESSLEKDWSSNILIGPPSIYIEDRYFMIIFTTPFSDHRFNEYSIRTLPIKMGDKYYKLNLPNEIYTDTQYKISSADIRTCTSTPAQITCGPMIVKEKLTACELALFHPTPDDTIISECLMNTLQIPDPTEAFAYNPLPAINNMVPVAASSPNTHPFPTTKMIEFFLQKNTS